MTDFSIKYSVPQIEALVKKGMKKVNAKLKVIYDNLFFDEKEENGLETERARTLATKFFDTYCRNLSLKASDKFFQDVYDIISEYEENAFSVGFYTAVELLTGKK